MPENVPATSTEESTEALEYLSGNICESFNLENSIKIQPRNFISSLEKQVQGNARKAFSFHEQKTVRLKNASGYVFLVCKLFSPVRS